MGTKYKAGKCDWDVINLPTWLCWRALFSNVYISLKIKVAKVIVLRSGVWLFNGCFFLAFVPACARQCSAKRSCLLCTPRCSLKLLAPSRPLHLPRPLPSSPLICPLLHSFLSLLPTKSITAFWFFQTGLLERGSELTSGLPWNLLSSQNLTHLLALTHG